jgi:pilus assembly protein Flp/PilA
MKRFILKFLISDDGPTSVEYAVMLAMIIGVCIISIDLMGRSTAASFSDSASEISTAMGS